MSDELVSRLLEHHEAMRGPDYYQAAQALSEARAEIEEWRQAASVEAGLRREFFTRAEKAESELSTLRARVREVVGPFAKIAGSEAFQFQTREWRDLVIAKPTGARLAFVQADSFRAARQLNEDLK